MTVRESNSSDEPGDLVATLTNPMNQSADSLNTFTVPTGETVTLDANTTYWVSVNEGAAPPRATVSRTSGDGETGESGWTIGNSRLDRSSETDDWDSATGILMIKVNGTVVGTTPTNTDATGAPGIDGTPQVGETLTATAGDMADTDNLPATGFPAGYGFQWVRVDSGDISETDIGTDLKTYVPVAVDVGHTIRVEVTFEDEGGTPETLPSDATQPVAGAKTDCPIHNEWCREMESGYSVSTGAIKVDQIGFASAGSFGAPDDDDFSHAGRDYTVTFITGTRNSQSGTVLSSSLNLITGATLPDGTVFTLKGVALTVGTDSDTSSRFGAAPGRSPSAGGGRFAAGRNTRRPPGKPRRQAFGSQGPANGRWPFAALLAAAALAAEASSVMVLEGDASAAYARGEVVVFERPDAGARGAMVAARASAGGAAPTLAQPRVVARAAIGADGGFRLEVALDRPRPAYFVVENAVTPDGLRMGAVQGNDFILEPGELALRLSRPGRFVVEGGRYNDAVYNVWRLSDDFRAAQSDGDRLAVPAENESEAQRRRRVERLWAAQETLARLETRGMAGVATAHPDPVARRLAIESARLGGPWMLEALHRLAELAPGDPWVLGRLAQQQAIAEYVEARRKRLRTGDDIVDFTGETLDGRKVRLADVRAGSRYVLVEFWASWCGPCRVEIPHMKQAYARFRGRGFEIVSFTVDEDREDWAAASAEERLPWLDLGMGLEAEAAVAYDVVGVPRNYLVDSGSGRIVARDLRQHRLDEKLGELLGD